MPVSEHTDSEHPSAAGREGQRGRKLLLGLAALLIATASVEILLRFALGRSPDELRSQMILIVSAISERVPDRYREGQEREVTEERIEHIIPHPYTAWDDKTSLKRVEQTLARAAELRQDPELAQDCLQVLVSGGSVALLFRRRGEKVLTEELERSGVLAGRKVEYLNFARAAYKQPQQVTQLAYLLALGVQPDIVLNIDGYNEIAIGHRNLAANAHPLYPAVRFYSHVAHGGGSDPEELDNITAIWSRQRRSQQIFEDYSHGAGSMSALVGLMRLRELRELRTQWTEAQLRHEEYIATVDDLLPARGPAFEGDLDETLDLLQRGWYESSISMHALCRERGITYLHVLQPTLADAQAGKPLSEFEQQQLLPYQEFALDQAFEAVQQGYDRLRESGTRLQTAGVNFLDATQVFAGVKETLYTDFVHFNRRGNELLGKLIAERLSALLE